MEESLEEVKKIVRDNLRVSLSLESVDESARTKKGIQHFHKIRPRKDEVRTIYESVLQHALSADLRCPGAGLAFMKAWSSGTVALEETKPLSRQDVLRLFQRRGLSKTAVSMLMTALDHATTSTNLAIKKSTNSNAYLEINEGYSFNAKRLFSYSPVILNDCYFLCIDGYVEKISELHHVLETLSSLKLPCLLFCRGMSNDVLHTIKVNYDRKTLILLPFTVPFDVDNANILVDLATVAGCDVVSSLKGDLISSVELSKFSTVESVVLSSDSIRVKNTKTRQRVNEHIVYLKKKINERPEIEEVLSKRLKSLSASCIDISLPDDINFYSLSQQFDEGIRIVTSLMNNSYDVSSVVENTLASFNKMTENTACVYFDQKVSTVEP